MTITWASLAWRVSVLLRCQWRRVSILARRRWRVVMRRRAPDKYSVPPASLVVGAPRAWIDHRTLDHVMKDVYNGREVRKPLEQVTTGDAAVALLRQMQETKVQAARRGRSPAANREPWEDVNELYPH